jgi:hypothetical protein
MSFANFLENKLLDNVWGASAYSAPATLYVGLSTTTPNDDGSNFTEPVGASYGRASSTNNLTEWPAAFGGSKTHANNITFATATGSWGTITHAAFFDASSGGNMLGYFALTSSITINNGDTAEFVNGAITITLD